MATQQRRTFTVGFTRLDGVFRHAEVPEGTTLGQLLRKFGYNENEIPGLVNDVRIGGNPAEGGEAYVLKKDDTIAVVPPVKGGK